MPPKSSTTTSPSDQSSSMPRNGHGRFIYTEPLRPTAAELTSGDWLNSVLAASRQSGQGEIVLIQPPDGYQFPSTRILPPSPHSYLYCTDNYYSPSVRGDESERTKAWCRSKSESESSLEVKYESWQKQRRQQEKNMKKIALEKLRHQSTVTDSNEERKESAASALTDSSNWSHLPQPVHPLFTYLPKPLQQLEDPLSIRAFIEAQRVKSVCLNGSPSFCSPKINDCLAIDDIPTAAPTPQSSQTSSSSTNKKKTKLTSVKSTPSHEPIEIDYVSYDCENTPLTLHVRKYIELPPLPDPSGSEDTHIRYCKNAGSVVMLDATHQQQQPSSVLAENLSDPFIPADPLFHLRGTLIHSHHPANLLSLMNEEYANKRATRLQQLQERGVTDRDSPATAFSVDDSSDVDMEDDGDDVELTDDSIDTTGTGVLEPTLYCGVRGSMTSMHSENDQLSSFHQISAGLKVWYSVESTVTNNRKLLKLMRSLQWINGFEEEKEEEDDGRYSRQLALGTADQDYGFKSHLWFFNPQTLIELGMDVHITFQTPIHSLVLTTGCFHQILNLTAVEGWSCNFLPPCMIPLVQSVREERKKGWQWNYQESISLIALCWKLVMLSSSMPPVAESASSTSGLIAKSRTRTVRVNLVSNGEPITAATATSTSNQLAANISPTTMQLECARVLLPAIEDELQDRVVLLSESKEDDVTSTSDQDEDTEPSSPTSGDMKGILSFPLKTSLPPRSYPELCTFCQNLSFFSAVYAGTGHSASAASSSSSSQPFMSVATAFHLCCVSCLVKYVRLEKKYGKKRPSKKTKFATKTTALTFATAGHLPSDGMKEKAFYQTFRLSLQRHQRWWKIAYLGIRVTNELLEAGRSKCQTILTPPPPPPPSTATTTTTTSIIQITTSENEPAAKRRKVQSVIS